MNGHSDNAGCVLHTLHLLPQLLEHKKADFPYLDINWSSNNEYTAKYLKCPVDKGVIVDYIQPDGTGDKAGLQRLDILTKIGDIDIDFYGIGSKTDENGLKKEIEPFQSYIKQIFHNQPNPY